MRRLMRELMQLRNKPPEGIRVVSPEENMLDITGIIEGPGELAFFVLSGVRWLTLTFIKPGLHMKADTSESDSASLKNFQMHHQNVSISGYDASCTFLFPFCCLGPIY